MTGQAHWLPFLFLGISGVGLAALWVTDALAQRGFRREQRRFRCPHTGKFVDATVVREASTGAPTGVASCSAFLDPEKVVCGKDCVQRPVYLTPAQRRA